jgi:O-antigen ligase
VRSQLPRVGIDDLEFLLYADREGVLHAAAIIVREVAISLDRLVAVFTFAIALASPPKGLLLVAALAPLGHGDAIAAAFIAGWVLRGMPDRSGPRVVAPLAGWLFCALVAGSIVGVDFEPEGFASAVRFLLGFALAAATVRIFRVRPELSIDLPAALAAGGCGALGFAVGRGSGLDWRAVAALCGLVACLAVGMSARASGRARLVWAAACIALFAGVGLAAVRSPQILSALSQTQSLIAASLRATASSPWFGIGIGRDRTTTPLYYPASIAWHGGALGSHNLLAIGVELGLVGLGLWAIWIGAGFLQAARALIRDSSDARLWGATGGVAFYVAALAVGRPLAFSETAFPFLIQFGLMTGLAGSTLLDVTPAWTRRTRWQVAVTAIAMAAIAAGALISARRGAPAQTGIASTPAAVAAILRSR